MQQSKWVKRVLKKTPKKRDFRFNDKTKNKIKKRKYIPAIFDQHHLTKQNVIGILNHYKIFSLKKLYQWNSGNQYKIPYKVIICLFGSWKNCKRLLNYDFTERFKYDQLKVIQLSSHFKICSVKKYKKAHQLQPQLFPSVQWIKFHFKNFSNFVRVVKANIVEDILSRFFQLKLQLGRYPTQRQCFQRRIQIDVLHQCWNSMQLKKMISYLESEYEKQRNNKSLDNHKKIDNIEIE